MNITQKLSKTVRIFAPILFVIVLNACGSDSKDDNSVDPNPDTNACSVFNLSKNKISNGETCTFSSKRSPLVRLDIKTLLSGGTCTGSIISSNVVLTAAHCFDDVVVGVDVVTSFGTFQAVDFGKLDSYDRGSQSSAPTRDAAFVRINGDFGVTPLALLQSADPVVGEPAFIGGFGLTTSTSNDSGIPRAGEALIAAVTTNHVILRFQGNQAHPCFGDSGGPVVVERNGQPVISGVVSGSSPGIDADTVCAKGDETLYTSVRDPSVRNFIQQVGGNFSSK